jgi:TolB protein
MRHALLIALSAASVIAAAALPALPPDGEVTRVSPAALPQQGQTIDVALTSTGSHPRVGIPTFVTTGSGATVQDVAATLADVLAYDLDFEREYYIIPRKASASIPLAATPETLPFDRWTSIGADYVLLGTVQESGGKLSVTVRMVNVKSTPGKLGGPAMSYEGCTVANVRYCAHSIADDLHRTMRGVEGVARTKIAFTSDRAAQRMTGRPTAGAGAGKEIYIMDYDGANPRPATANRSLNLHASWSPDGQQLAYTTYARGTPDIFLASLFEARTPQRPAASPDDVHNYFPAISPDNTKLAFARAGAGNFDVWVVNRDGTGARNLTPNTKESSENVPFWSPGGNQIVFTSDRSGSNQVYVMNASDGLSLRRLTTAEAKTDRPRWAPAPFNYIAFVTGGDRVHDVAVLDLSTMQTRILTDGASANDSPTIAPNGRHIAFVTSKWGRDEIAIIDYPDGKNLRRLTEVGNNTYPSWSPTPGK